MHPNQSLHPLGKISKTHGYNGSVVLISDQPLDDELENLPEISIVIDGLPVPFPVKEWRFLTDTSALLQLEFVNKQEEALEMVGCEVYADVVTSEQEYEAGLEQWVGLEVHDTVYGNIGIIRQIEDYKGNIVLQVMDGEKETLIALFPELVTDIDNEAKILHIAAPDGYFDED